MNNMSLFKIDKMKYYTIKYGTLKPSIKQLLRLWLNNFGFHCVIVYRFGRATRKLYNKNKLIGIIPVIIHFFLNTMIKLIHHVDIHKDADIGPGFYIVHHYTIIIGDGKIGANFTIHHNLTIGERVANLDHSVAEIGDNVWIGPNVVISGGIKIGSNSTISAGSIISKDIPERCLVGGNPGRVIMNDYDNSPIMGFRWPIENTPNA